MAIKTINELNEASQVGENDYLLISAENTTTTPATYDTKKIKANMLGGGGDVEVLEMNFENGTISTVLTAGEIKALFNAGKICIGVMSPAEGVISQAYVSSIAFSSSGGTLGVFAMNESTLSSMYLQADTDADPFSAQLG